MILIKKNITINNPSGTRVRKLIPINARDIAMITDHAITIHDMTTTQHYMLYQQPQYKISEVIYNPRVPAFYLILKGKGYIYGKITLKMGPECPFELLYQFDQHEIKYDRQREIKPKMIMLSCYEILLRKFYNDTLVVVFREDALQQQFYINEECLSSFDGSKYLVNYRKLFHNRLSIDLIDVSKEVKLGKFHSTLQSHRINYGQRGIVMSVEKVPSTETMLICLNEKQGNTIYIIYDYRAEQILKECSQQNSVILKYFFFCDHSMCLYRCQDYKHSRICLLGGDFQEKDAMETQLQFQEWEHDTSTEPILINYSQHPKEKEVRGKMIRLMRKKEIYLQMGSEMIGSSGECLVEMALSLL